MDAQDTGRRSSAGQNAGTRIAVRQGAHPDDWREVYDRLTERSRGLSAITVKTVAAAATFAGVVAVSGLLGMVVALVCEDISSLYLACCVIPPGLLVGAAVGQAVGNLFLRLWFGLDTETRRGFAMRLTLACSPEHWPSMVKRWLFTGDWLGSPSYDLHFPYLRIFVVGNAPTTCREEDRLWREIHALISGEGVWEAGSNHREFSYPSQLPGWARDVGRGFSFRDLQKRIGAETASEWVSHLWRRACRQWPDLGGGNFPVRARKECFEIHSLALSGGRQALAVVLRPASFVAEIAVDSANGEVEHSDSLAA